MLAVVKSVPSDVLRLGVIEARGITPVGTCAELDQLIAAQEAIITKPGYEMSARVRQEVRRLLKAGGYHPSGRGRPASEYLIRDVQETGRLVRINLPVDVNNYVSIVSGLPASIFDLAKVKGEVEVRIGEPGESYVFNREGQVLDLKTLMCVCDALDGVSTPIGTPVKDSMATKISESTRDVLGILYGTTELYDDPKLKEYADLFGGLLARCCAAASVETWLV